MPAFYTSLLHQRYIADMLFIGACQVKSKLLRIYNAGTHLEMIDHVKTRVEMLAELQEADRRLSSPPRAL